METIDLNDQIQDYGVIAQMWLPEGWRDAGEPIDPEGIVQTRCWRTREFSDVVLYLRFSGRPNGDFAQSKWMELIEAGEEHVVQQSDIQEISLIVGDVADEEIFEVLDARAENWNGKRVLLIEGTVKDRNWRSIHMFADIYGDGAFTQEITFGAPRLVYDTFVHAAVNALQTISWKPAQP
jgi:hypothetical protein